MFVIVRDKVKSRLRVGLVVLFTALLLSIAANQLFVWLGGSSLFSGTWQEDRPSGNPMRVEGEQMSEKQALDKDKGLGNTENKRLLDKFVVKIKNLYDNGN